MQIIYKAVNPKIIKMKKNSTQVASTPKDEVDPVQDFNENCKKHIDPKEKNIWLCYDCHKFTCTKCYAKEHKHCWADLIENMYSEMQDTNKANLEAIRGMRAEFQEEVEFMNEKYNYFIKYDSRYILLRNRGIKYDYQRRLFKKIPYGNIRASKRNVW